MYPVLIDESQICEEFEALGIALYRKLDYLKKLLFMILSFFVAGSLPEFLLQNTRQESFKLFDEDRGVYVLEDIATNPAHPDHKKLIIAYKKYMMNAAQSASLKANAINIKDAPQFAPNPINDRISYWE
uniref:Uncharacterized protein n=1 Tax=Panagrolaimus sp. ES5 TaxID=591445 RepID=A0AC34FA28_9BILA